MTNSFFFATMTITPEVFINLVQERKDFVRVLRQIAPEKASELLLLWRAGLRGNLLESRVSRLLPSLRGHEKSLEKVLGCPVQIQLPEEKVRNFFLDLSEEIPTDVFPDGWNVNLHRNGDKLDVLLWH